MFGIFLLSKHFKLGIFSSYLAAFIYMLSGQYAIHIASGDIEFTSLAFFPFIFLYYLKSFKYIKYFIFSAIFMTIVSFNASIYELLFISLFLFIYSLFNIVFRKKVKKTIQIFLLVILFSFLLSSIKTLPSLEFSRDIPRITF